MLTFFGWTVNLTSSSRHLSPSVKRSYSVNRRTLWWSCHPDGWFDSRRSASPPVLPEDWSSRRQEQHLSRAGSVSWWCSPDSGGSSVRSPLKNRRMGNAMSLCYKTQRQYEISDFFLNETCGALVCLHVLYKVGLKE